MFNSAIETRPAVIAQRDNTADPLGLRENPADDQQARDWAHHLRDVLRHNILPAKPAVST